MAGNYYDGIIEGLTRYAWWKDGVQYVGTCGSTLKQAIADVEAERQPDTKEEKIPSPNTTNGEIKPCSNKECENYDDLSDEGDACRIYDISEHKLCSDYRA